MKKSKAIKQFHYISDYAKDLLDTIPKEFEVDEKRDFKFITLKELGFTKDWIRTEEFLNDEFLAEHNLALCNPEDVFEISKSVKWSEYIYIGMKHIPDRYGDPSVFDVFHRSDGLWLYGHDGRADHGWDGERSVGFPRK